MSRWSRAEFLIVWFQDFFMFIIINIFSIKCLETISCVYIKKNRTIIDLGFCGCSIQNWWLILDANHWGMLKISQKLLTLKNVPLYCQQQANLSFELLVNWCREDYINVISPQCLYVCVFIFMYYWVCSSFVCHLKLRTVWNYIYLLLLSIELDSIG